MKCNWTTLFAYTFAIAFAGNYQVLLCLEFSETSLMLWKRGYSLWRCPAIFAGGLWSLFQI